LKAPFTSNPICGILADRRSGFASCLVSASSLHDEFCKNMGGRRAIQKPLNGSKLNGRNLASRGKIQGTLRISRHIDLRKCKSVNHALGSSSRSVVPLNCFLIRWLKLGSAKSWRRFANSL
jgi:hypothetical protein